MAHYSSHLIYHEGRAKNLLTAESGLLLFAAYAQFGVDIKREIWVDRNGIRLNPTFRLDSTINSNACLA